MPPAGRSQGMLWGLVAVGVIALALGGVLFAVWDDKTDLEDKVAMLSRQLDSERSRVRTLDAALREAVPWFVGEGALAGDQLSRQAAEVADAIKKELLASVQEGSGGATVITEQQARDFLKTQGVTHTIQKVLDDRKQRIATLESRLETLRNQQEEEVRRHRRDKEDVERQMEAKIVDVRNLEATLRKERDERATKEFQVDARIKELERNLEAERRSSSFDKRAAADDLQAERDKIRELQNEILRLKRGGELASSSGVVEEDGRVLEVDRTADIVVMDIGGKEHVRSGMFFDVYWREKGGLPQWKGKVEVIEVHPRVSRARIVRTPDYLQVEGRFVPRAYNDNDPITPGCIVANPYFFPGRKTTFALVGEFQFHTRGELVRLITADGESEVVDDVAQATFVVLGRPPKVLDKRYDRQVEEIRLRRLQVMTEEEFMRYLRNYKQDSELLLPFRK